MRAMAVPRTSASEEPKRWPLLVLSGGVPVLEGARVVDEEVVVVKVVVELRLAEEVVDALPVELEDSVSVEVLLTVELVAVLLALEETLEETLVVTAVPV
jgi:hypothetical protein